MIQKIFFCFSCINEISYKPCISWVWTWASEGESCSKIVVLFLLVTFSYWRVGLARDSWTAWHPKRPISFFPDPHARSLRVLKEFWTERIVQSSSCTFLSEARDLSLRPKLYFLLQLFLEGQIVLENIKSVPDRSLGSLKGCFLGQI